MVNVVHVLAMWRFCFDQDGELLTNLSLLLLLVFFKYYFSLNGQSRVAFTNADSPVTSNSIYDPWIFAQDILIAGSWQHFK